MRRVLRALALCVAIASPCAGCMDTRTAALGVEQQRVPGLESDAAGAPSERDAGATADDASTLPPERDPPSSSEEDDDREDGADADDDRDSARSASDSGQQPSSIDAGPVSPAAGDARAADTSVALTDERDAGREDARVPVNPLCIAEPWHCQ